MSEDVFQQVDGTVRQILEDRREYSDYTQISLSIQAAVRAAHEAISCVTMDSEVYTKFMGRFIYNLAVEEVNTLLHYDITFKPKVKP